MMPCDRIREQIPEVLAGRLDPAARERLIDHKETCSACRSEVADLGVVL
jgi:anti-sigma factor RsiW